MKKISLYLIAVNLILLFSFFGYSVYQKEQTLKEGQLVLLELAPVDPRSLLQGDYMRLNYAITRSDQIDSIPSKGYFIVTTDKDHVAKKLRVQEDIQPLNANELALLYKVSKTWDISIGMSEYFFQEGQGDKYSKARYGGLKMDRNGVGILTGLYDEKFKLIK